MKKYLCLLVAAFILLACNAIAQSEEDFVKSYINTNIFLSDTEAAAAVIYEKASIDISPLTRTYEQIYKTRRIVKILKEEAIDEANVIDYFAAGFNGIESYVKSIEATTYNIVNGEMVKTQMDKSAVFYNNMGDFKEMKFTLPTAKVGSIISYSYEIHSPASFVLTPWYFQNEFPTLKSEYEISIPAQFSYVTISQSTPPFKGYNTLKSAEQEVSGAYIIGNEGDKYSKYHTTLWGRRNIPAMKQEDNAGNVDDYRERIDVQIQSPDLNINTLDEDGLKKAWRDFNTKIWQDNKLGRQFNNNSFLDPIIDSLTRGVQDPLQKAKRIFAYVRGGMHCSDKISADAERDIKKAFDNKDGNAAEINVLLVAMLKEIGLEASPVLMSTHGRLKARHDYPMLDRFNHMIGLLLIDSVRYYLDASDKYNAFGRLPEYCYNGYSRVLDKNGGYPIMIMPQSNKERTVIKADIVSLSDVAFRVNITEYMGMNMSSHLRTLFSTDTSKLNNIIQARKNAIKNYAEMESFKFENIDNPDTNLIFRYTLYKKHKVPVTTFYFSADIIKILDESPFKPMHRRMPLELNYADERVYVMNAIFPDNMAVEEMPKPAKISYGDKIVFKHMVGYDTSTRAVNITTQLKRNECYFEASEYNTVRDVYEKIVKEINQTIVLKKP